MFSNSKCNFSDGYKISFIFTSRLSSSYVRMHLVFISDGSGPNFFGLGQAQQLILRARASSGF